jgi:hypothetical protein
MRAFFVGPVLGGFSTAVLPTARAGGTIAGPSIRLAGPGGHGFNLSNGAAATFCG